MYNVQIASQRFDDFLFPLRLTDKFNKYWWISLGHTNQHQNNLKVNLVLNNPNQIFFFKVCRSNRLKGPLTEKLYICNPIFCIGLFRQRTLEGCRSTHTPWNTNLCIKIGEQRDNGFGLLVRIYMLIRDDDL